MAKKIWHPKFIEYMQSIVSNPSYSGLAYITKADGTISWIASRKSPIGTKRKEWADRIILQRGWKNEPGIYARLMIDIHPTKSKPCQICGNEMSLYYIYLNSPFLNTIYKKFGIKFTTNDSINDVKTLLIEKGYSITSIITFIKEVFDIKNSYINNWEELVQEVEQQCRNGNKKFLGPGAMSNFPDRFDGFHTYNRCHRSIEDKGRHKDNMKTYNKDRRAYEYWSDGNIHGANKFMNSLYFKGSSADHIGPISLGFKHDSLLLRPMSRGANSSKRDHLQRKDIETLIEIENIQNNFTTISWFSELIWNHIKTIYRSVDDFDKLGRALKKNLHYYMYIIWEIKTYAVKNGERFLIEMLLKPKYEYFQYDNEFNELGVIINQKQRNITEATKKEFNRFVRIALNSVDEFYKKENRRIDTIFKDHEKKEIQIIIELIDKNEFIQAKKLLQQLVEEIENGIIYDLDQELSKSN